MIQFTRTKAFRVVGGVGLLSQVPWVVVVDLVAMVGLNERKIKTLHKIAVVRGGESYVMIRDAMYDLRAELQQLQAHGLRGPESGREFDVEMWMCTDWKFLHRARHEPLWWKCQVLLCWAIEPRPSARPAFTGSDQSKPSVHMAPSVMRVAWRPICSRSSL